MTPSVITLGQVGKLQEVIGAALRKSDFPQEVVQRILETQGSSVTSEWISVLKKRVDAQCELVRLQVSVDRSRSARVALEATRCELSFSESVAKAMPRSEGEEVELVLFQPGRYMYDDELETEYELRGLVPADPYSLAAAVEADLTLLDRYRPLITHWRDAKNKWCSVTFKRGEGIVSPEFRGFVRLFRHSLETDDRNWFAGFDKRA